MTADRKPDVWSESIRVWIRFVEGTDVRPRRAREAFWRWEQTWERLTRDILWSEGAVVRCWRKGWWSPDGRDWADGPGGGGGELWLRE